MAVLNLAERGSNAAAAAAAVLAVGSAWEGLLTPSASHGLQCRLLQQAATYSPARAWVWQLGSFIKIINNRLVFLAPFGELEIDNSLRGIPTYSTKKHPGEKIQRYE